MGYDKDLLLITETGVSWSDVHNVIGAGNYDLGSMSKHPNITIWAKYKPVNNDNQWGAKDFGLTPKSVTGISLVAAQIDGGLCGWVYNRPTDITGYKVGHFRKYWQKAPNPVGGWLCSEKVSNATGAKFTASIDIGSGGAYNVALQDFESLKNCYLGVCLQMGSQYYYVTSNTTLAASTAYSVEFSTAGMTTGTWTAFPFLCTSKQTLASHNAGTFYTIPYCGKKSVTVSSGTVVSWYVFGYGVLSKEGNTYTLDWSASVVNDGTGTLNSVSGIKVVLMRRTPRAAQGGGEVIATLCQNATCSSIAAGSSKTAASGSYNLSTYSSSYVYELATTASGVTVTQYSMIELEF